MPLETRLGRGCRSAGIALILAGAIAVPMGAARATGRQPAAGRRAAVSSVTVTPVEGPSTLHHLGLTIEKSSMGWDGQWSPPPTTVPPGATTASTSENLGGSFVLSGADLYRISCRACHKADGSGAPPEINSLIGPVQAASVAWMTARMKERGRPVDPAFIRDLTRSTEADLRKRLKVGGHNMPSFDHLSDDEIRVLRPYLNQLAGVPDTSRGPLTVTEPADRVGELVVKGTCHICHDATRADNPPTTVLSGVIPALASMPHDKTFTEVVRKVHEGAPVALNAAGVPSRGRMPVFNYFTQAEIGAAYSYLMAYPPR